MDYYIIVFKNTHDAMAADKMLKESGYEFKIMPTPTTITMSCGICVRIDDKEQIESILKDDVLVYKNIYHKEQGGYMEIK